MGIHMKALQKYRHMTPISLHACTYTYVERSSVYKICCLMKIATSVAFVLFCEVHFSKQNV